MISTPFTAAINHLLAQEPWAKEKLTRHAGKIACFDVGFTALRVKVAADGMLQPVVAEASQLDGQVDAQAADTSNAGKVTDASGASDVTIRARLADLPLIARNRDRAFSYVQIEGDADFANTISQLSQSLRWEAEADLSRWIGDIAAVRVVGGARAMLRGAQATQRALAENLAEYLLEENPLLVRPQAVSGFADEVARLRDDLERLGKRIDKLKESR